MPEFRQDWATKEWVIIATERAKRPEDFAKGRETKKPLPEKADKCPFCPGNEDKTPPSLYTIQNNERWNLRVVPNKFAALQPQLTTIRKKMGKFLKVDGFGVAEVVIETPKHNETISSMSDADVRNVIITYRNRYLEISRNPSICLINIFRNHGAMAGTSLEHPHSQIIATPIVPPHIRDQITQAILSSDTYGSCIYCDIIKEEINQKERIIIETEHFASLTPFASRYPFEVRIYPKKHRCNFGNISDGETADLAHILKTTLKKIHISLNNPDYNYMIRSGPTDDIDVRHFHWYLEILPKLTTSAGFELGTGIFINVAVPEDCAKILREVKDF